MRLRHWTVTREHAAGQEGAGRWPARSRSTSCADFDEQELRNALDQVRREVIQRFDLKNATRRPTQEKTSIVLFTDDEFHATVDEGPHRVQGPPAEPVAQDLRLGQGEPAGGNKVRQVIGLRRGLPDDLARKLIKLIRDEFPKVQPPSRVTRSGSRARARTSSSG